MHAGVLEWCHDWYGPYPHEPQVDPVGRARGIARVIRGGGIQQRTVPNYSVGLSPYYARSANRGGLLPAFRPREPVGFRVVEAELPPTAPLEPEERPFVEQCVKPVLPRVQPGAASGHPHFKQRPIVPIPPENVKADVSWAAGLPEGLLGHNHSPGLEVMPNGDLLALYFTSDGYEDHRRDRTCVSGEAMPDIALASGTFGVQNGTPMPLTMLSSTANRPAGSHWCHMRNGSAIAPAAKSTMASTVQLNTVPK